MRYILNMKKLALILSLLMTALLGVKAEGNFRLQVDGPENSYNMVRVVNLSHYTDFTCTVYFLDKHDDKFVVASAAGTYKLAGTNDHDSNKVRVRKGNWLGVKLPDDMTDVSVSISYKDLPMFDIVNLVITDGTTPAVGEEF